MQVSNGESGASAIPEIKKRKRRDNKNNHRVKIQVSLKMGKIMDPHYVQKQAMQYRV